MITKGSNLCFKCTFYYFSIIGRKVVKITRIAFARIPTMPINDKDSYFVAVKVFLEKDGNFLVMKDNFGDWDLPGGRIKKDEFETPLEDVVVRKMNQEVGADLKYKLGKPIVFMRHERIEDSTKEPARIFAIGYQATWISGEVKTSDRHTQVLWADQKTFKPEDYFKRGWLKGVRDYMRRKVLI